MTLPSSNKHSNAQGVYLINREGTATGLPLYHQTGDNNTNMLWFSGGWWLFGSPNKLGTNCIDPRKGVCVKWTNCDKQIMRYDSNKIPFLNLCSEKMVGITIKKILRALIFQKVEIPNFGIKEKIMV